MMNPIKKLLGKPPDPQPTQRDPAPRSTVADRNLRVTIVEALTNDAEPEESDAVAPESVQNQQTDARIGDSPEPFAPIERHATVLVRIIDDSQKSGEVVRFRGDRLLIGKDVGDITIPHDGAISDPHLRLQWRGDPENCELTLKDLDTATGTFAMVRRSKLRDNQEFQIGCTRVRFFAAGELEILSGPHTGQRFSLEDRESWIGRDPEQCQVILSDDLMVDARQSQILFDDKCQWHLEDGGSLNGTWIRIPGLKVKKAGKFQIGEQRLTIELQCPTNLSMAK